MSTDVPSSPLPGGSAPTRYRRHRDSSARAGVPRGALTELTQDDSAVYPGTSHRYWVHVPAQYDESVPASLLVVQDGEAFADLDGEVRVPIVLDNLVHDGHLPPTIAVLVEPGTRAGALPGATTDGGRRVRQRNVEYDAADDRFARFLLDEVLPEVASRWVLTDDPDRRAIVGFSSGGNAAFTAAWHRPGAFGRVGCFSASFAQMPGGNPYPSLVTAVHRRPLRVFLQVGHHDLGWDEPDDAADSWLAHNLAVAAALAAKGYDLRVVVGDGGHDLAHAGALFPDVLRWLFRAGRPACTTQPPT